MMRDSARMAEASAVRRNRMVSSFVELTVLIATLVGLLMGISCIYWVKVRPSARHALWGRRLFVATLLGNVTPGNADLIVVPGLEPLLAPSIASKVKLAIAEQLGALRREEVSLSFSPKAAIYEVSPRRMR